MDEYINSSFFETHSQTTFMEAIALHHSAKQSKALILLVEDLPEHAEFTRVLLENHGYQIVSVSTSEDALRALEEHDVDAILLDVMLDGDDGFRLCEKIRQSENYSSIPIMMLTSRANIHDKITGFKIGADDYLTKPFKPMELLARLELLLRKRELQESEERYRDFVENINDIIVMLNTEGLIESLNKKAESELGVERQEVMGKPFDEFILKNYRSTFRQCLQHIRHNQAVSNKYLRLRSRNKNIIPVEMNASPLLKNGKITRIRMILHDISERERLQAEIQRYTKILESQVQQQSQQLNEAQQRLIISEKMAAVGQLAAGIAHELRNPLSTISSSIYFLSRVSSRRNPKIREHLQIIEAEIRRAQRIITNLLDFSRRSVNERSEVNINKVIEQTVVLVKKELVNHDVTLKLELGELPLCFVDVDELKQVFLNLIINAKEAMPNGGTLTIRTYRCSKKKICIEFEDTGIGIPQKDIGRIFDPFFTTKSDDNLNGTGIGLSIVHSCIKRNKGSITVSSQQGKGTLFRILLPAMTERKE